MRSALLPGLLLLSSLGLAACGGAQKLPDGGRLLEEGRYAEALDPFRRQLAADPADSRAREGYDAARRAAAAQEHLRAQEQEKAHKLGDALLSLQRALELDPELQAARYDESRLRRQHRLLARSLREAEATLARGDCLSARAELEALLPFEPTFPAVATRHAEALELCCQRELTEARRSLELGNYERARLHLAQARGQLPEQSEIAPLEAAVDAAERCAQLWRDAGSAMTAGDPVVAAAGLHRLLEVCPEDGAARAALPRLRGEALRASLAAAARDLASGAVLPALVRLEDARGLGVEDPALAARLTALLEQSRGRVAAQMVALAEHDEAAGLPGAALLRYRIAAKLAPSFASASAGVQRAQTALAAERGLAVAVPPAENPGPFAWLGKEFGQTLAEALAAELEGSGVQVVAGYGERPEVVLEARLERFSLDLPDPGLAEKAMTLTLGERRETNPAMGRALAELMEARRAQRDRPGDLAAQTRVSQAYEALGATPAVLTRPEQQELRLPVAKIAIAGSAGAQFLLRERHRGQVLLDQRGTGMYRSEDSSWPALEELGVKARVGELPSAVAVRRRLLVDLAEGARKPLATAVREYLNQRYQRLARATQGEEALHYWALALEAGGQPAEEAKEALAKALGYQSDGVGYDARRLSL